MKVRQIGSALIDSKGVKAESAFKINASAQAFRILSSGLYSDKISAILREIGCNAADSHVAAGCPTRPIEVKLPSALDREFYIKDYGIGLTHEEITGLFTTYFSSNKGDRNDMTGAFGLGSKSPFCYTDSFAITSARDGVQRAYTAYLSTDGAPVVSLLNECQTSPEWPNGMMISFSVNPEDIQEFHEKAEKVFTYFEVKPQLLGGSPVKEIESIIKGKTFYFPVNSALQSAVVMGNVAYPLDPDQLGLDENRALEVSPLSSPGKQKQGSKVITEKVLIQLIANGYLHLVVPIGSVLPTASREGLEYDPKTRENVLSHLKAAVRELVGMLDAKAKETFKSKWAWHQAVLEYAKGLPHYLQYGESLLDLIAAGNDGSINAPALVNLYTNYRVNLEPRVVNKETSCDVYLVRKYSRRRGLRVERRKVIAGHIGKRQNPEKACLNYKEKTEIFYVDSPHGYARVKKYVEDNSADTVVLIERAYKKATPEAVKAYAQLVAASVGELPIKATSTLEVPALIKANRGKAAARTAAYAQAYAKETAQYYEVDKNLVGSEARSVTLASVPKDGMYYAVTTLRRFNERTFRVQIKGKNFTLTVSKLTRIMQAYHGLYEHNVPLKNIQGFVVLTTNELTRLKLKKNGWKSLFEVILEQIESPQAILDLKRRVSKMPEIHSHYLGNTAGGILGVLANARMTKSKLWAYLEPKLKEFPVLQGLWAQFAAANDSSDPNTEVRLHLKQLVEQLGIVLEKVPRQMSLEALNELLLEAYPLLEYLDSEAIFAKGAKHPERAYTMLKQVLVPKESVDALTLGSPKVNVA